MEVQTLVERGSTMDDKSGAARDPDNAPPFSRLFVLCDKAMGEGRIRALFEPHGAVEYCRVLRERDSDASKGVCYVKYEKASHAALAIEALHGATVDGCAAPLKVQVAEAKGQARRSKQYSNEPEDTPPRSRLFVVCPRDMTQEDLRKHFEPFGNLEYCKVMTERGTNISKGFSYVKFSKASSAALAMESLNETGRLGGRKVKVLIADPKAKRDEGAHRDHPHGAFAMHGAAPHPFAHPLGPHAPIGYAPMGAMGVPVGVGPHGFEIAYGVSPPGVFGGSPPYAAHMAAGMSPPFAGGMSPPFAPDAYAPDPYALGYSPPFAFGDAPYMEPPPGYYMEPPAHLFVVCSKRVTDEQLAWLFAPFALVACGVQRDAHTGESCGCALVCVGSVAAADMAVAQLDGSEFPPGCVLRVVPSGAAAPAAFGSPPQHAAVPPARPAAAPAQARTAAAAGTGHADPQGADIEAVHEASPDASASPRIAEGSPADGRSPASSPAVSPAARGSSQPIAAGGGRRRVPSGYTAHVYAPASASPSPPYPSSPPYAAHYAPPPAQYGPGSPPPRGSAAPRIAEHSPPAAASGERVPAAEDPRRVYFVLDRALAEPQLRDIFSRFGTVVRLQRSSRGDEGCVTFRSPDEANYTSRNLSQVVLDGRAIRVRLSKQRFRSPSWAERECAPARGPRNDASVQPQLKENAVLQGVAASDPGAKGQAPASPPRGAQWTRPEHQHKHRSLPNVKSVPAVKHVPAALREALAAMKASTDAARSKLKMSGDKLKMSGDKLRVSGDKLRVSSGAGDEVRCADELRMSGGSVDDDDDVRFSPPRSLSPSIGAM